MNHNDLLLAVKRLTAPIKAFLNDVVKGRIKADIA